MILSLIILCLAVTVVAWASYELGYSRGRLAEYREFGQRELDRASRRAGK